MVPGTPEAIVLDDQVSTAAFEVQPLIGQRLVAVRAEVEAQDSTRPIEFDIAVGGQPRGTMTWSPATGTPMHLDLGLLAESTTIELAARPQHDDRCAVLEPWQVTLRNIRFITEEGLDTDSGINDYLQGPIERVVVVVPQSELTGQSTAPVFSLAPQGLEATDLAALDAIAILGATLGGDIVVEAKHDQGPTSVGPTDRVIRLVSNSPTLLVDSDNGPVLVVDANRPGEALAALLDADRRPTRSAPLALSSLTSSLAAQGHGESSINFELDQRVAGGLVDSWTIALIGDVSVPGTGESGTATITTTLGDRVIHTTSLGSSGAWWITAYAQSLEEVETLSVTVKYALGDGDCDGSGLVAFTIDAGSTVTPTFRDRLRTLADVPGIFSQGYFPVADSSELPVVAEIVASIQQSVTYPLQRGSAYPLNVVVNDRSEAASLWIEGDGGISVEGSSEMISQLMAAIDEVGWKQLNTPAVTLDPQSGQLHFDDALLNIEESSTRSSFRPSADAAEPALAENPTASTAASSQRLSESESTGRLAFLDSVGTPGLVLLGFILAAMLIWTIRMVLFEEDTEAA